MNNPCYKCEDRTAYCHAKCQEYKDFSDKRNKELNDRARYNNMIHDISVSRRKNIKRSQKEGIRNKKAYKYIENE